MFSFSMAFLSQDSFSSSATSSPFVSYSQHYSVNELANIVKERGEKILGKEVKIVCGIGTLS